MATIESTGDIESICESADGLKVGDTARLVFRAWDECAPPFTVKVRGPDGKTVLERVIRELPTGKPQSAPPIAFPVQLGGKYQISIKELYGKKEGLATLTV